MRNTLPAMSYVQTAFVSLAGQVGVGVEGSNATVQGDDQWHTNGANNLALPPMDPYGPTTRWFDVFSRGTNSCTWQASPWAPWVRLSQYNGTVGPGNGTDSRVFVSIDWASAPKGPNTTTININITTPCQSFDKYGYKAPMVQVPVQLRSVPANFTKGFVESDGHVSIEGAHYQAIAPPAPLSNSTANKRYLGGRDKRDGNTSSVTYHTFQNYGRISSGVGLWPQNTDKLTVNTAPSLEYSMYLFTNTTAANVTVFISPSQNYLGDTDPLQYGIALYPTGANPSNPTIVRPVGNSIGANLPDGWGYAVADGVWGRHGNYTTSSFKVPQEGAYTLRIWALLPSIIVQKIVVDLGGVRPSYLGPPESYLVSRDQIGGYNQTSFEGDDGTVAVSAASVQASNNSGARIGGTYVLASVAVALGVGALGARMM